MFDTLVKLAGLGAGGICIFAIFWVGWLISKLPSDASARQHRTLRLFMAMTIGIAVIAFASGIANAWFNAQAIARVEQEKEAVESAADALAEEFDAYQADTRSTIAKYQAAAIRSEEVVKSLAMVVDEKELAAKEDRASPEMQSHIRILRKSIDRLKSDSAESDDVSPP